MPYGGLNKFEQQLLRQITELKENAYGLLIKKALESQMGRAVALSRVHLVCNRLETKGYLTARHGARDSSRGGRRRKLYQISSRGKAALYHPEPDYSTRRNSHHHPQRLACI